jgi:hypothetical protein
VTKFTRLCSPWADATAEAFGGLAEALGGLAEALGKVAEALNAAAEALSMAADLAGLGGVVLAPISVHATPRVPAAVDVLAAVGVTEELAAVLGSG